VHFTFVLHDLLHRSLHAGGEANSWETQEMNGKDRSNSDAAKTGSEAGATPPFDARCVTGSVEALPPLMEFPSPCGPCSGVGRLSIATDPEKFRSVLDSPQGEPRMKDTDHRLVHPRVHHPDLASAARRRDCTCRDTRFGRGMAPCWAGATPLFGTVPCPK